MLHWNRDHDADMFALLSAYLIIHFIRLVEKLEYNIPEIQNLCVKSDFQLISVLFPHFDSFKSTVLPMDHISVLGKHLFPHFCCIYNRYFCIFLQKIIPCRILFLCIVN